MSPAAAARAAEGSGTTPAALAVPGGSGGGIYNETSARVTVTGSTISGNSAGAGGDGNLSDSATGGAGGQAGSGGGIA